MKWLVALFLVWITLRGRFETYRDLATTSDSAKAGADAGKAAADGVIKSTGPLAPLIKMYGQ